MDMIISPSSAYDAWAICNMRQKVDTRLQLRDVRLFSVKQCVEWIENLGSTSERLTVRTVADTATDRFVGLIRIDSIDTINGNCCLGLDIDHEYRGKGLAKLIYKTMLKELFMQRRMQTVWLEVLETNKVAISLYKKLGFKTDGVLRNRIFRNGEYINCLAMSMTADEWKEQQE